MNRQQITRRMVLAAFTVALALPGLQARATVDDGGYYDQAQFKGHCEETGGIFTDTEDGNTWCQWDDDSQTVCDDEGQDCHDIESGHPLPPIYDHAAPWAIADLDADPDGASDSATTGGTTAPAVDSLTPATAQPSVTAADDDRDQNKDKDNGKKHKKGGKGRRK